MKVRQRTLAIPKTAVDGINRRTGGRWTALQTAKNFAIANAVRAAFVAADHVPGRLLLALGRLVGRAAFRLLPRSRSVALSRASACFPRLEAERVARASFERAGENLAGSLLLRRRKLHAEDCVRLDERSQATLRAVLSRGRGAVFVSAHLGPFEHVAARIAELGFRPVVVVRESYDPRLDEWVDAHRTLRGVDVVHRGSSDAALRILRALRAGRPVGFLPDLGGRVPSMPLRFLGEAVAFPIGPQEIALRADVPILIGTLERELTPANEASRARTNRARAIPRFVLRIAEIDATGNLSMVTQRVAAGLEAAIRNRPDDWLWMAEKHGPIAKESTITLDLSATCQP